MRQDEMIALLRAQDERGLAAMQVQTAPLIRYVISPILPDPADRDECLCDVTLRIWERIGDFEPDRGSWNAWVTAIARNAALDRARQNRRHATEPMDEQLLSPEPTPEEAIIAAERREALRRALDSLSSRDRLLFYRKYYYLQPTAQIAAELGLTERAVEGRLYRIKNRLRTLMGGDAHG